MPSTVPPIRGILRPERIVLSVVTSFPSCPVVKSKQTEFPALASTALIASSNLSIYFIGIVDNSSMTSAFASAPKSAINVIPFSFMVFPP